MTVSALAASFWNERPGLELRLLLVSRVGHAEEFAQLLRPGMGN